MVPQLEFQASEQSRRLRTAKSSAAQGRQSEASIAGSDSGSQAASARKSYRRVSVFSLISKLIPISISWQVSTGMPFEVTKIRTTRAVEDLARLSLRDIKGRKSKSKKLQKDLKDYPSFFSNETSMQEAGGPF